jgi:hypothetical protein
MIPTPLVELEVQLRRSVEAQQFANAARLATEYCEAATDHIGNLPAGSMAACEIAKRVRDVLDWTNLLLLIQRASISDRLTPLLKINGYFPTETPRNQMRIEA